MGKRTIAACAVVLMVFPLIAGCSLLDAGRVVDILGEDNAVRQELSALVEAVASTPGVESVESGYDPNDVGEPEVGIIPSQVEVKVEAVAGADLLPLAEAVRVAFSSGRLAGKSGMLVVREGATAVVEVTDFGLSSTELGRHMRLRSDASNAIGRPLLLRVGADAGGVSLGSPAEADLTALLEHYTEVADLSAAAGDDVTWLFAGIVASGALPPAQYAELLGQLAELVPVQATQGDGHEPSGGISLWAAGPASVPTFRLLEADAAPDGWRSVVDVSRAMSSSGVRPVALEHFGGGSYEALHFGDCPNGPPNGQYDPAFIRALAAEGVPVTIEANLGICEPIAQ